MRTITQLREDIKILLEKLGNMRSLCANENRDPSKEERAIANQYLEEIAELEEVLELELRAQATMDRTKEPEVAPDKPAIDTRREKESRKSATISLLTVSFFRP